MPSEVEVSNHGGIGDIRVECDSQEGRSAAKGRRPVSVLADEPAAH